MRRLLLLVIFALLLSPVWSLSISTDREIYSPAEEGMILIEMDVPRDFERVILEIEVLDDNGVMVYADILQTQIPLYEDLEGVELTQSHVSWSELPVDQKIQRYVPFVIPITAASGNYSVVARAMYHNYVVDSALTRIEIIGGMPIISTSVIVLVIVLLISLILWKEV